jgi:AcrR family transcriptional regulator
MDAVEALMREKGYAALSARNVAARAGLKYQIVFYYFETMDALLLATYRRRTHAIMERTHQALTSERPLHALWSAVSDPLDASLSLEYMALSNHSSVIRAETIAFGEQLREVIAFKLHGKLKDVGPDPEAFTPFGITLLMNWIGVILGVETALGISGGHVHARAIMDWWLNELEREPPKPTASQGRARGEGTAGRKRKNA